MPRPRLARANPANCQTPTADPPCQCLGEPGATKIPAHSDQSLDQVRPSVEAAEEAQLLAVAGARRSSRQPAAAVEAAQPIQSPLPHGSVRTSPSKSADREAQTASSTRRPRPRAVLLAHPEDRTRPLAKSQEYEKAWNP